MPVHRTSSFAPTGQSIYFSNARAIWKRDLRHAYNCHLVFRKRFICNGQLFSGELRISASDTYRLFVNGQFVGDGPARSERGHCYVDHYPVDRLPFSEGENIIVILALNKNLAEHGQPPKDGAVIMSLDGSCTNGESVIVRTGPDWKVQVADWYLKPAPRRFFPVGFNEVVDFRIAPQDVISAGFSDTHWPTADAVDGRHLALCTTRPIPTYQYNHIFPKSVLRAGKTHRQDGALGVALLQTTSLNAENAVFRTQVYAERETEVYVYYGCDNYSTVSLNGREVWRQGAPEHGFRQHLSPYEDRWYAGMFHGHGIRFEPNASNQQATLCQLNIGWNEIEVNVHFVNRGYGFELALCDPKTHRPLPIRASASKDTTEANTWEWRPKDKVSWSPVLSMVDDQRPWLEPSHLASWDKRELGDPPPEAENLFRFGDDEVPLVLHEGDFIELEMETYCVGYLKLTLAGPPDAVVELAVAERNDADSDRIPLLNNGLWLAERVILSGGLDRYTSLERRAGRYIYLCVRQAEGPVTIGEILFRNQRYQNARQGEFHCNDEVLNWMWDTGVLTTELATFDLCEDCPTREMAQWSGDSFLRTHLITVMWGDLRLSEKAIREFALDQIDSRWGRAMVPAGYGDSIVDYALLLPIWAWTHYEITGDRKFLTAVYPGVRNLFKFAVTQEDARGYLVPTERSRNQVYLDMKLVGIGRKHPLVSGLQAYYVKSLECGARIAELLNQVQPTQIWRTKAEILRKRINEDFWAVDAGLYVNGEDADGNILPGADAGMNYIMLWANIPTPEYAQSILRQLFPSPTNEDLTWWTNGEGAYLKHFMADALLQRGRALEALTSWRGYYGSMMGQASTIPEAWDRSWANALPTGQGGTPSAEAPTVNIASLRSLVHPFSIGPLWHFMTYICGIQAAKPGYSAIRWAPMPADLTSIQAKFPLPGREEFIEITMESNERGVRELFLHCPADIPVEWDKSGLAGRDQMTVLTT